MDQSCIASETEPTNRPFPTKQGNGPGVIILEDDVFPSTDVGPSSEGPGTGQCSRGNRLEGLKETGAHPSGWRTILWILRLLIYIKFEDIATS